MSPQGGLGRCRGVAGDSARTSEFHTQAAWIMLRTPLEPRFWSFFVWNSQTVQRFSSFPMLMRIAAQAAAIRGALLQNAKWSNDFFHVLNQETLLATSTCPCHNRCTLCRDSAPMAGIDSPCAVILLRLKDNMLSTKRCLFVSNVSGCGLKLRCSDDGDDDNDYN